MPYERDDLATRVRRIESDYATLNGNGDSLLPRSNLSVMARVQAKTNHTLDGHVDYLGKQIFPKTAEDEFFELHTSFWNVPAKGASFASGTVTFSGVNAAVIPVNTIIQRSDGIQFSTQAEATIVAGTAQVFVEAITVGTIGNTLPGTTLNLTNTIEGVNSQVTIDGFALAGGADQENREDNFTRLLARVQEPPHGGNANDFENWALEVEGVTRAKCFPQELGLGTVTVRFMMDDTYEDGIPTAADVTAVYDYIEERRQVTGDLFVVAPIADPVTYTISGLNPVEQSVKDAIEAELKDLHREEAKLKDSTLLISHIRAAISRAAGEYDHQLDNPVANVTTTTGKILTFGGIVWA